MEIIGPGLDRDKADFHHPRLVKFNAIDPQGANFNAFDDDLINPNGMEKPRPHKAKLLRSVSFDFYLVGGAGFEVQRGVGQGLARRQKDRRQGFGIAGRQNTRHAETGFITIVIGQGRAGCDQCCR
eukprot:TRINITY_DN28464_c0_g1_i1.p2 TRINITY_DN28464_c0_g1~~TRINITY_DN28464_c0_g1_i1.p2  ORF type:complete len:126 (+),score=9.69 TRINITY_DN28464_c0_g1_i1:135-512(+)